MEYCGAEEVSHVGDSEQDPERNLNKDLENRAQRYVNGGGKPESKPQRCGNGIATQAQCRALYALTKKAQYTEQDIESLLTPLQVTRFQDLTRESASQLITYLQTEVAA